MAKIRIVDDLSPEDVAMLQALYSRSAESVDVHLEKVRASGSGKFMSRFYVGYNHKSIADCGDTTIFIEGVSLLAAKAIQDWPLYSGQETSTRFIDMTRQPVVSANGTPHTGRQAEIIDGWMKFYTSSQERMGRIVRQRYPRRDGEKEGDYENAVKARVFDSLRGFLPAGITTQLSWHTNLRQAGDHIAWLMLHPVQEIRDIATAMRSALVERYPSSGFAVASAAAVSAVVGSEAERATWAQKWAADFAYPGMDHVQSGIVADTLVSGLLHRHRESLATRPRGSVLPHFMADIGQITFAFPLDFGSFRDIQRHRNGVCRMPLLTTDLGFAGWYLDQLDDELRDAAKDMLAFFTGAIGMVDDRCAAQYLIPIGFRIPCEVSYALPAALYVMELRSGKTIHPTLRRAVHEHMAAPFRMRYPEIALHADTDPDDWTVRRGQQTITER